MRKDLRNNLKKITAFVLAAATTLSMNTYSFADDIIPVETQELICVAAGEGGLSSQTVNEVIDGVTHQVTYQDQGDGSHQAIACKVCTDNSKEPKDVHCAPGASTVPHYFDENRTCVGCGLTVAADELDEELKEVDLKCDYDTRLREYLALKYSTYNTDSKTNVRGKQYLSLAELNSIPANIVIEIGNDTNAELKELTKYMVNFNSLVHLKNVKTIKIYGADIRFLYLPKQIETLVIQDSTFNLYRPMGIFTESENNASSEGTKSCTALKNATLNNVTIGNHYEGTDRYIDNYYYHILNSTNLESFNINVKFTEPEQRFVIDAGTTSYSSMNSCTISNGTEGTGRIVIKSSNNESYFAQHFSQYMIEEANLESHFRTYLTDFTDIDSNHDKIITQAELDAVTDLHITYKEALMSYMDAMNDLRDIAKFRHLKTLTIDADVRRTGFHIDNIAFPTKDPSDPDTGKLESITINDLYTKLSTTAIAIPYSVKKFEYIDNFSIDNNNGATFTISDNGSLEKVTLDRSNVKSVEINNATSSRRSLSLSAKACNKLEYIQLGGNGYHLSGEVALNDCGNLTKIGKPNTGDASKWTVYLAEGALLNLTNCTNFGTSTSNIEINTNKKEATIWAYGVNQLSTDSHTISINESVTGQSNITLRFNDTDTWLKGYAESIGATRTTGSSVPNVACFRKGNKLRTTAKADATNSYDRWIDRYEVEVLRKSDPQGVGGSPVPVSVTDQEFSTFEFYVEEKIGDNYTLRKVTPTSDQIEIISTDTNLVVYTDKGFDTHSPGRVSLEVYWKNADNTKTKIGQQDILVANFANDIDLKMNNPFEGELGTRENPIYVERTTGNLSLSAQVKYEGGYLRKEVNSVLWGFTNGASGKDISSLDTTKSGLKVVRDTYTDPTDTYTSADGKVTTVKTNNRVFSLNGACDTYYIYAQVPFNRRNGFSGDDNNIRKSFYVEQTGPCEITTSKDTLVQESSGAGSVDITVSKCKNVNITIKDAGKYNNLLKIEKNSTASAANQSVWRLHTEGSDQSGIKDMMNTQKSVTLIINADHGIHEKTINLSSSWSPSSPGSASAGEDSEEPTPTPAPSTPIKDPDAPTTGKVVKDDTNSGDYVLPDPTRDEVVYKAPENESKKTVTIPDKIVVDGVEFRVVKIDPGAFKGNENVTTINIGKNIETIGAGAFEGAAKLTEVTIGESVETIGDGAFKNCKSLKTITIPSKTKEIGDGAFEGNTSLTKVTLGQNVETIGDGAFKNCKKLTSISIPSKAKEIGDGAFSGDSKLKKVTIGKSVEAIGDGAFKNCKALKALSLPSKTVSLGKGAFNGCSKLTSIKISSTKLTKKTVDAGAFNGLAKNTTIKVPKSKLKTYMKLFKQKGLNSKIKIKGY